MIDAHGLIHNTPVELHQGIWVKREDLCAPYPGPQFSKYRGVVEHIAARPDRVIGVLDTFHSKAGWAVAYACKLLGKHCVNFYPLYKADTFGVLRKQQQNAREMGAQLVSLPAGRSAVLYHQARKKLALIAGERPGANGVGYLMPNALKLSESVERTGAEAGYTDTKRFKTVVIAASSGTIAAGVIKGLAWVGHHPKFIIHLGYSRPEHMVRNYLHQKSGVAEAHIEIVDEGYQYKDAAKAGASVPFPCNPYYDLKAWYWLMKESQDSRVIDPIKPPVLFWNIGS